MIQILSAIGFSTVIVLFLSMRYYNDREELYPKWWYGLGAICIVCHFALALMIYEEHLIFAIFAFVGACGLAYITCRIAVIEDRLRRIQKR